jgi:hypothetical protein
VYVAGTGDGAPNSAVNDDYLVVKYNPALIGMDECSGNYFDFNVFPNPFNGSATIQLSQTGDYEVVLYEITGRKVMGSEIKNSVWRLLKPDLAPGLYLLTIFDHNSHQRLTKKVVVK